MIPPEAWQAFAGVAAVIVFLGAVVFALQRLGFIRPGAQSAAADNALAGRVDALERELMHLRLHLAEHYISREDWVPTASRVLGMLEEHTELLARLDERTRHNKETI